MAQDFKEGFDIDFPLYTDPSRESYKAFSFARGHGMGLRTLTSGFGAASKGFRQGSVAGDPFQQGGEILFSQAGELLLKNSADKAGEHIPMEQLLNELRAMDL
jgi:hypothetical protein